MAQYSRKRALIGIGHELCGDEKLGLEVVRKLKTFLPADFTVIESDGEVTGLAQSIENFDEVFVVDTLRSMEFPTGTMLELDALDDELPAEYSLGTTDSKWLDQAIEIAKSRGRLPRKMVVFAIEGENFEFDSGYSIPIRDGLKGVCDVVYGRLNN